MIVRTVLDLRTGLPKFILQTLLLAASWHRFAQNTAQLEVLHIGELPPALRNMLNELGVKTTGTEPNSNDVFSKTSNTIQGAKPVDGHQILLLDNDVTFTGSIDDLCTLPSTSVYGAVAGIYRVTAAQWAHIKTVGLVTAPCTPQTPRTALVGALANRQPAPAPLSFGYANGGVILFPSDYDFRSTWVAQQRTIAQAFDGHPLHSGSVTQSNMAALATTIGSYGTFNWLPPGYNYRHADFAVGLCPSSEVRLVHMTGLGKRAQASTLSGWVNEYWSLKMTKGLNSLRSILHSDEFERRLAELSAVHRTILTTIATYDLDQLAEQLIIQASANPLRDPTL